jgi:hypothetical protein
MENKLITVKLNFEIQLTENDRSKPEDFFALVGVITITVRKTLS